VKITNVQLAERVEEWQQRLSLLGVAHFRIAEVVTTSDVPGWAESNAGVSVAEDYDTVTFYFDDRYVEGATAKQLDETILHEWVHVAMRDLNNATSLAMPWMPSQTWSTFDRNLDHHKETLVDRVSRQLYAFAKPRSSERCTFQ
jgi:hypothetical protein